MRTKLLKVNSQSATLVPLTIDDLQHIGTTMGDTTFSVEIFRHVYYIRTKNEVVATAIASLCFNRDIPFMFELSY